MRIDADPQAHISPIVPSQTPHPESQRAAHWRTIVHRRARTVRDVHYSFEIRVAAAARRLRARQRIELTLVTLPEDGLWLDWRPRDSARWARSAPTLIWNGDHAARHGASLSGGYLRIPRSMLVQGQNWMQLDWDADILPSGSALTCYRDPEDGARYIYTLFVPADASSIFPCFDQPDLKARFSLSLSVPHGWQAVSNAPLKSCETSGRARIFDFLPTEPISTYLFAFAAGAFRALDADVGDRCTQLWVRRSQERRARREVREILALNERAIRYFTSYFGHRFPFAKYDLVLLPDFPYRGMEHAGATFLNEHAALLSAAPRGQECFDRAQLVFHETAHQWLGDLVTMRSFDDLWIKEGFANFMAYKLAARGRFRAYAEVGFHLLKASAYATDESGSTRALHDRLPNAAAAKLAYGTIVYGKAPALLRQWEDWVGPTVFRAGVREFVRRHAYDAVGWRDLILALQSVAGARIAAWSRAWILRAGVPLVELELRDAGPFRLARLRQVPRRARTWPLQMTIGDSPRGTRRIIHLSRSARLIALPQHGANIAVDPEDTAYAAFRISARDLLAMAGELTQLRRPLHRIRVWQSLWQAAREARISPAVFIDQVLASLGAETQEAILANVLEKTRIAMDCWLTPPAQSVLAVALDTLLWRHMREAPSASLARSWLEGCIALSRSAAGCELLSRVATAHTAFKQVRVDDALRLRAAGSAIARGVPLDARALTRLLRTATERRKLLLQAASPDPHIKRTVLRRFLTEDRLPDDWIVASLPYFNHPAHASATIALLPRVLHAVPRLAARRKIFFVNRWLESALGGQTSARALVHVRAFLTRDDWEPAIAGKVRESMDSLERTVRIRRRWPHDG